MKVTEIRAKSILTKSRLPESDYCINPYVGCLHGCVYCYARFMRRFTGHTNEEWGTFVDVRVNASEILTKQLARNPRPGVALLGSVTDAYQPVERKYGITRSLLRVLLEHQFPVSILTKSKLVLRDVELIKRLKQCEVGLTITSLDDKVSGVFEPRSSGPADRINALKRLHAEGIATYVFIGPILPLFTDLRAIFKAVRGHVDAVWAETLNIRCGNWSDIERTLRDHFPDSLPGYRDLVLDGAYWGQVGEKLSELSLDFGIPLAGYYRH